MSHTPTRSSTCCATARCTTPRACSTAAATGSTSPSSARQMAEKVAATIAERDIVHLRSSPLERARQTAAPLALARGLEVGARRTGPRVDQQVRGGAVRPRSERPQNPATWRHLWNPFKPSWGEPYKELVARMMAAIEDARAAAEGHEAVIVSHQLPIWITRLHVEKRSFLHDPRKRQCTLCSLTSLHFVGERLGQVSYSEPAGDLIPAGDKAAPFSAGGAPEEKRP